MKLFLTAFVTLFAQAALAYVDGTYTCKTAEGVPDQVIKIETQTLSQDVKVPYVQITRYFRQNPNDPNSPFDPSTVKGFATISTLRNREIMLVAALRLDFVKDELQNCRK